MNEMTGYIAALCTGGILGWFFLQTLWWTTRKGLVAKRPALWFLGSNLLRTGIVLFGFYLISAGQWQRMTSCLLGFVIVRILMMRKQTVEKLKTQVNAH